MAIEPLKCIERPSGPQAELIDPSLFRDWIVVENDGLVAINKPGWIVCHPSKNGPLSSLVGACREILQLEKTYLVSRLDRETSGIVVVAKTKAVASQLQQAFQNHAVTKKYYALLKGTLAEPIEIDAPLAKDLESPVAARVTVRSSRTAKSAITKFIPLASSSGFTLARVQPLTGRKHQIRAHAFHMGFPIIGDKIYGDDDSLFLDFIQNGWTERLAEKLPIKRQALHAGCLEFHDGPRFTAPLAEDMIQFCRTRMKIEPEEILARDMAESSTLAG